MKTETQEFRVFQSATGRQRLQIRTRTVLIGEIMFHESTSEWKDVPVVYEGQEQFEDKAT